MQHRLAAHAVLDDVAAGVKRSEIEVRKALTILGDINLHSTIDHTRQRGEYSKAGRTELRKPDRIIPMEQPCYVPPKWEPARTNANEHLKYKSRGYR